MESQGDTAWPPAKPSSRPPKSQRLNDLVMGTNNNSITSKRSVERLYHPDEPHYFRFFVKKFQRRAPLINRGYWLRLKAIDTIIHRFLSRHCGSNAVVINLGCGSDVIPWQCLSRYPNLCRKVLFVDIDYPDLMHQKRSIVLQTPQLREILGTDYIVSEQDDEMVLLRSENYCQIGCDLRELNRLSNSLNQLIHLVGRPVLFVAEVSITYIDTKSADALIEWASSIGKSEFCLLEQLLPQGPDHPFASTMLDHFHKLNTPLRSVLQYPLLSDQVKRFSVRGFPSARIWDLWEAWSSDEFLSNSERLSLDVIEPFDEWEEFILFGRHYFILHALSCNNDAPVLPRSSNILFTKQNTETDISVTKYDVPILKRRFGDASILTSSTGCRYAVSFMGLGAGGREESCDVYALDGEKEPPILPSTGPASRMCHTLTDLGEYGVLLTGGRCSPANALSDCWLLEKGSACTWKPTHRLPIPLYRHSAIRIRNTNLALVAGGKSGATTQSGDFYVFHALKGWLKCNVEGDDPPAVFGAALFENPAANNGNSVHTGLLTGGIGLHGKLNTIIYRWHLVLSDSPIMQIMQCESGMDPFGLLSTFGARIVNTTSHTMICGGVGGSAESLGRSIVALRPLRMTSPTRYSIEALTTSVRKCVVPFMIGSSTLSLDDALIVLGGGATCFSMGTFWETGSYLIKILDKNMRQVEGALVERAIDRIEFVGSRRVVGTSLGRAAHFEDNSMHPGPSKVSRISITTTAQFDDVLKQGVPVIIEGAEIGSCVQSWSPSCVVERVGFDTKVTIHDCLDNTETMDFISKNFRYATERFGVVLERAAAGEKVYLRALSRDQPTHQPANIEQDFPELAMDFCLPETLSYVRDHLFSSVLRVSGRVNMWLHYDVMANLYVQISGRKRMILFPPEDVNRLAFAPGASSSSFDVFSELKLPRTRGTHPHEAILEPGDILYLPPFWPHTATPLTDLGIAVNAFFRNLHSGYAEGRDIYGNRDIAAYEKGRRDVARIGKYFQAVPPDARRFYLKRLAEELDLTT